MQEKETFLSGLEREIEGSKSQTGRGSRACDISSFFFFFQMVFSYELFCSEGKFLSLSFLYICIYNNKEDVLPFSDA